VSPRAAVPRRFEQARLNWAKAARRALEAELPLDSAELRSLLGIVSARIEP
jgi:hypothetical protein